MKKLILLAATMIAASTFAVAQDRFSIGLRTGATATFHLEGSNKETFRNHISYNGAIMNQVVLNYSIGKSRKVLLEAGVGYARRKEISQEMISPEFSGYLAFKTKKETLNTIIPSLRISYQVAKMKTIDWKHYTGVTLNHEIEFYKWQTVGNEDVFPNENHSDRASTTLAGIHYNGIIGITKKIAVNYIFSLATPLEQTGSMLDSRAYYYNGMFGLSYKL